MKKFYVKFRKNTFLANHYVTINAFDINEATSIANSIFKNVDMVYYEEKFNKSLYFKGELAEIKSLGVLFNLQK